MQTFQEVLSNDELPTKADFNPNLILVFASRNLLENDLHTSALRNSYPNATFFGCSTSGEIAGSNLTEGTFTYTAIKFDGDTSIKHAFSSSNEKNDSFQAGVQISEALKTEELRHILVLSDGQLVNGSELAKGLNKGLPRHIAATGGLAGDGTSFEKTIVLDSAGYPKSGLVTALGFYGKDLEIGFGSMGGWESFGVDRVVTKSDKNVLYEIDHEPALQLYKSFLGDNAKNLPASALLFPLSMSLSHADKPVVRTILNINEEDQSLVFAGDIPEGSQIRLMKSNSYKLIDGAEEAAEITSSQLNSNPDLAILVSCVGRKLVMNQLAEEEVEVVKDTLKANTVSGFYSYGELAPFNAFMRCELHNQTMTITTFKD